MTEFFDPLQDQPVSSNFRNRKKNKRSFEQNQKSNRRNTGRPLNEVLKESADRIKEKRQGTTAWKVINKP